MYLLLALTITFVSVMYPIVYYVHDANHAQKCAVRPQYRFVHRISQPLLFYGLPDLFLLSNLLTVYALCKRHQQMALLSCDDQRKPDSRVNDVHSSRKQRQLTVMLITVSLTFYLFSTPAMIIFITELFPAKNRDLNRVKRDFLFGQISVVLLQLNNAVSEDDRLHVPASNHLVAFFLDELSRLLLCWSTFSSSHTTYLLRIFHQIKVILSSVYSL